MQIHLDRVQDGPFLWDVQLVIAIADLDRAELSSLEPVRWHGRLEPTEGAGDFLLRGRLEYRQELLCARCLEPFWQSVERDVDLLVQVTPESPRAEQEREYELTEEDLNRIEVAGQEFDTLPLVRDLLQLEIPMQGLCRPDCGGLCPRCGANLNAGDCGCVLQEVDPRWKALEGLDLPSGTR